MKKKIIAWSDFIVPTGFGNVAKNLFANLHQKYDVSVVAINYRGNSKYDTSKWFVYPTTDNDIFNTKTLLNVVAAEKPEIIILFQDSFNIAKVIKQVTEASPASKIISYFPVDASSFNKDWDIIFKYSSAVIQYTKYSTEITKVDSDILYHGVDMDVFKPLPIAQVEEVKANFGWTDKFILCNVNRFQPRKAVPSLIRAYSIFAKGGKVCKCGNWYPNHLSRCDLNGCSVDDVQYVIPPVENDTLLYLHMMPSEVSMGLSKSETLFNHAYNAGFTDDDFNKIIAVNGSNIYKGEVSEEDVNMLYNISNYNITTSLGEGFGLSLIESMATGTRTIAPNNSAIKEVLKDTGILVRNEAVFSFAHDNGFVRPLVSIPDLVRTLKSVYEESKSRQHRKIYSFEGISKVKEFYDWEKIRQQFMEIIERVGG